MDGSLHRDLLKVLVCSVEDGIIPIATSMYAARVCNPMLMRHKKWLNRIAYAGFGD